MHRQIHNAFQTAVALAEWESRSSTTKDADPKELVLGKKQFKQVAEVSEGFDQYMTDLMGGRDESDIAASNWQRYDFRPAKVGLEDKKKKKKKAKSESEESDSSDEEPTKKTKVVSKKDSDDSSSDSDSS